jgi:hypothetical protein
MISTRHGLTLSAKVRLHCQAGPRKVPGTATGPIRRTPEERNHYKQPHAVNFVHE